MAEKKPKPQTRTPGAPRGLVLPERVERKPEENPMRDTIRAATAGAPPTPRTPPTPPTDATHPIAPERDFTRVPNSVVRDVVPAGHFVGKSKQLYDCLYQRTRGAIVPTRRVAISKPDLMNASGIGSERTLLKNLAHLKSLGLLRVSYTDGKHEGNTYEVLTPDEAGLRTPPTPRTPPTAATPRHARSEVPPVPPAESGVRDVGSSTLESSISDEPKTSLKTNTERTTDDEAAPVRNLFFERFEALSKSLTGKGMRGAESSKWLELFEVLETELRIAAGRTTVSSVPAFLAEHLRRRLWKKEKRDIERDAAEGTPQGDSVQMKADSKNCSDCFGTGMFYPEGFDKGVARCAHQKLSKNEEGK